MRCAAAARAVNGSSAQAGEHEPDNQPLVAHGDPRHERRRGDEHTQVAVDLPATRLPAIDPHQGTTLHAACTSLVNGVARVVDDEGQRKGERETKKQWNFCRRVAVSASLGILPTSDPYAV